MAARGDSDLRAALIELTKALKDQTRQESQAAQPSQTPRFALEQGLAEPDALAAAAPRGPITGRRSNFVGSEESGAGALAGLGESALSAIPGIVAGAGSYAASKTPYGTTGTTDMLGQNLEMGALKSIADLAKPIPILGDFAQQQFKGLEEAVYAPEQRARQRLSPTFERLAQAGVEVSDQEIEQAFQYAIPVERRGVYMKQRVERIGAAVNAENGSALGGALSQIGL